MLEQHHVFFCSVRVVPTSANAKASVSNHIDWRGEQPLMHSQETNGWVPVTIPKSVLKCEGVSCVCSEEQRQWVPNVDSTVTDVPVTVVTADAVDHAVVTTDTTDPTDK